MPHLNWMETKILPETFSVAPDKTRLKLALSGDQIQILVSELEEALFQQGAELRLVLPQQWLLFWKLREGETRLLLAHPQKDEWVGTLALESAMARAVLLKLQSLSAGDGFRLSQLGVLSVVSNLDLMIERTE